MLETLNQQVQPDKARQVSPRSRPAPKELRKAIELVNYLSPDEKMLDFVDVQRTMGDIFEKQLEEWKRSYRQEMEEGKVTEQKQIQSKTGENAQLIEAYQIVVGQLPIRLQQFIGPITNQTLNIVGSRLGFLSQTVALLRGIAHDNQGNEGASNIYTIPTSLTLETDESGCIHYSSSPLLEALNGVEAGRIRECQICRKIFWAGRIDKLCCSKGCGKALRNRRWRNKYKAYLYQRYEKDEQDRISSGKDKKAK